MPAIEGTLHEYSEQGWEGYFELHLREDGTTGWDGVHVLSPGDLLVVRDAEGRVIFDGPLPAWTGHRRFGIFWREPRLPPGFFEWFRVHHHRATLRAPRAPTQARGRARSRRA